MKKLHLSLIALFICAIVHADTWKVVIGTNSVVVAPTASASLYSFADWGTNETYAAGGYADHLGIPYWTPNGGTSGTSLTTVTNGWNSAHTVPVTSTIYSDAPTHPIGMQTSDDGIIWKRVSDSGRDYLILYADTSNDVLYDINKSATTNSGGRLGVLFPKQVLPILDDVRARVESTGTATIRVVEF